MKATFNVLIFIFAFLLIVSEKADAQIIATFAGNDSAGYTGDGGLAVSARLNYPTGVAADRRGNLYIADYNNNVIRKINSIGFISTVAGNDTAGFSGDGGPATAAELYYPFAIAVDTAGNLYIADTYNMRVRKVDTAGIITTIAGTGIAGFGGDGGAATAAVLSHPTGICTDRAGNVYISDERNNCIREINTSGIMTTIAGADTMAGYSGDGGPATAAKLNAPFGLTTDTLGNIFIAEWGNNIIRKIDASGTISTIAGGGTAGLGDGGAATAAVLDHPMGVALQGAGNLLIADFGNSRIRQVSNSGIISTIAGSWLAGDAGDGQKAYGAELHGPTGLAVDGHGKIYIADAVNNKIRAVCPAIPPITGPSTICMYATGTYLDSALGGIWMSSDTSVATVSLTGVVSPVRAGLTFIYYSAHNSCGIDYVGKNVQVSPYASLIIGSPLVCLGYTTTLTDSSSGVAMTTGSWSSSSSIATVSGGVVTGADTGVATITYRDSTACGVATATKVITVVPPAGAGTISGPDTICTASTASLSDSIGGGVWSSADPTIVFIDSFGVAHGVGAGSVVLNYEACGGIATFDMAVDSLPGAGIITGPLHLCGSSTVTYTSSVSGGTWSSSFGHISIDGSGIATTTSTTNGEMDFIRYTIMGASCSASTEIDVSIGGFVAAGVISGPPEICYTSSTYYWNLGQYIYGNTWSYSSAFGNLAIDAQGNVVPPSVAGTTDMVIYTEHDTVCGTTATASLAVTIEASPASAVAISGPSILCPGGIDYSADFAGGVWSTEYGIISISADGSGGGWSAGFATGTEIGASDDIIYTITNLCGTGMSDLMVTIGGYPSAGVISGTDSMCAGTSVTLSDTASGGAWSVTNSNAYATGNIITGVTTGTDNVHYTVTNSCGSDSTTYEITIIDLPSPGVIIGPSSVCINATISLTETVSDGLWQVSNGNLQDSLNYFKGLVPGIDTVYYLVTNSCGTSTVSTTITINPPTDSGAISGNSAICGGLNDTLSESVSGGVWSTTNAKGTIDTFGIFSAIAAGLDTVKYSVTGICGTTSTYMAITINPSSYSGVINNIDVICLGDTVTLSDSGANGSGYWADQNANAAITDSGVITGVNPGVDTIYFTSSNFCGTSSTKKIISVNTLPFPGVVIAPGHLCLGTTATVSETEPGGTWSASNTKIAITGSVITAAATGQDTLYYSLTNSCGSAHDAFPIFVDSALHPAITSRTITCIDKIDTLESNIPGGTWYTYDAFVSQIDQYVMGLDSGIATIYYKVSNSCGTDSTHITITIFSNAHCPLGTANISPMENAINIFPNPAYGELAVEAQASITNFEIINYLGETILSLPGVNSPKFSVDISKLPTGIYLVRADGLTVRFVKN